MEYTKWEVFTVCTGKSFGILKNWGMTLASDTDILTNLIVSQACMYVGGHKPLFTYMKVLFLFTAIT